MQVNFFPYGLSSHQSNFALLLTKKFLSFTKLVNCKIFFSKNLLDSGMLFDATLSKLNYSVLESLYDQSHNDTFVSYHYIKNELKSAVELGEIDLFDYDLDDITTVIYYLINGEIATKKSDEKFGGVSILSNINREKFTKELGLGYRILISSNIGKTIIQSSKLLLFGK